MNTPAEKKETSPKTSMEARVVRLETGFEYLATKADIANVRTEIAEVRTEIVNVESRLNDKIAEVRTEIANVENRLSKEISNTRNDLRTEMKYNLILTFGALIAVALGLAGLMAKGFHWV